MSLNTIQLNTYTTEGTKIKATVTDRNHDILFDQPKERKGSDTAAKPTEVFLASLGACKLVVAKSFAKKHKINLKAVDITVEGEIDPKGFSQQDPEAKVGFSTLRTIFNIEADNTKEEICSVFGNVTLADDAFITESMTEREFKEKFASLSVKNTIRVLEA